MTKYNNTPCEKVIPKIDAICKKQNITFDCVFLPYSQAKAKRGKDHYKSLNWLCTLKKNDKPIYEVDYSQGIANCPAYEKPFKFKSGKIDHWKTDTAIDSEIENGRTFETFGKQHRINPPSSGELLRCLLVDVSCVLYSDFESFCAEFGYDSDSRKAKNIFKECKKTMKNLVKVFTYSELEDLISLANQG